MRELKPTNFIFLSTCGKLIKGKKNPHKDQGFVLCSSVLFFTLLMLEKDKKLLIEQPISLCVCVATSWRLISVVFYFFWGGGSEVCVLAEMQKK